MNEDNPMLYVGVLLPLALEKPYTFSVPPALSSQVAFGLRVEVQFGKSRHYSGLIVYTNLQVDSPESIKPIVGVLDKEPLITQKQFELWQWMAAYYGCALGEVMSAALPSNLKLTSETRIIAGPLLEALMPQLSDDIYMIAEALTIRTELGIEDVRAILNRKHVYPLLLDLLHQQIIEFKETLQERFKPKKITCVKVGPGLAHKEEQLKDIITSLDRAPKQLDTLMAFLHLDRHAAFVRKSELLLKSEGGDSALKALVDKGYLEVYSREISRLDGKGEENESEWKLSTEQTQAILQIEEIFEDKNTVLLHGITGSGKTLIYAELIKKTIEQGRQVLYLLPEIALTTQLIVRLERLTGREILTYHSRLNQHERVEIWRRVMSQPNTILIGPRSGIFLPWLNPGLVIVDEEHDASYKQHDPAPRYQGRDTALFLAHLYGAKAILGSATPSLESWHNARTGKYGLVQLTERYGNAVLPEIRLINLRQEVTKGQQGLFSHPLLEAIQETLDKKEQVILFQNRRGFAPTLRCELCQWTLGCVHCDVSLTYHKPGNKMQCHYCAYQTQIPSQCPKCGNRKLTLKGFGTQRIEDDLKIFFPDSKVDRLDIDTARSRQNLVRILDDFAERKIDILVGTQMITKGLDFENLSLVGILQADILLSYPEFRAAERAFQLMVQVGGRAGRQEAQGRVLIQTHEPQNPIMQDVLNHDLEGFYLRELSERKALEYPPFSRIIRILIKHKKNEKAEWAAEKMADQLRPFLGESVQGPTNPYVSRIGDYYLKSIQLKVPLSPERGKNIKERIRGITAAIKMTRGMSGTIIQLDVDPS